MKDYDQKLLSADGLFQGVTTVTVHRLPLMLQLSMQIDIYVASPDWFVRMGTELQISMF